MSSEIRRWSRRLGYEVGTCAVTTVTVFTPITLFFGYSDPGTIFYVLLFFSPVVAGIRLSYLGLDRWFPRLKSELLNRGIARIAAAVFAAIGLFLVGRAIPSLMMVIESLQQTAPPGAGIEGYLSGIVFVGGMMMAFDPALSNAVTFGVPALIAATVIEICRRYHSQFTDLTRRIR